MESALAVIVGYLERCGTPYIVIGGLANLVWGIPRATVAVDMTVWVDENDMAAFVEGLIERFHVVPENPVSFIAQTNVLPVWVLPVIVTTKLRPRRHTEMLMSRPFQ